MKVWESIIGLVEPVVAYFCRRWGYRRGVRIVENLRKKKGDYYRGRQDAWITINDYDNNVRMRIDRSAYLGGLIYWHGGQATYEFKLLRKLLIPDMVMMDVGANQGEATLLASKRLRRGHVFAFEPIQSLFDQLNSNIALNNFHNVSTFNFALSDIAGTLPMYTSMDVEIHSAWNEGLASLYPSDYRDTIINKVSVETLDTVVSTFRLTRLDIIKIDVEGGETKVLKGALKTLKEYKPKIIMEINPKALLAASTSPNEVMGILDQLGYTINIIEPNGNYHKISPGEELLDCDVYCEIDFEGQSAS